MIVSQGFLGSTASDFLQAGQVDSYSVNLMAGTRYYLDVTSASAPLDIALAGPQGLIDERLSVGAGTLFSFTPTANGTYGIGIDTATGTPGSYSLVAVPTVTETDTSTGVTTLPPMVPYAGPVAGLADQFVDLSSHNLNITATTPNVFLHSGSGEDALQVSAGTNVLDGSTGSNFLVGGSDSDTFFVDDRGPSADIWSTVVGFHGGDAATVWGVTPQDFNLSWVDNQGAAGFTGLTLHATDAGRPTASLTLAGFSTADLNNGRLSVTFGTVQGNNYMNVHG